MAGVDSGRFEPDSCTTQAMRDHCCWLGCAGDVIFDAGGGEWYSGAVQWARQKGVLAENRGTVFSGGAHRSPDDGGDAG